jgi:hypothetical protein
LTSLGDFSPLVDSGDLEDHYNEPKSCFLVVNFKMESNVFSKTGLGIKIDQFCPEIPLHFGFSIKISRNQSKNFKIALILRKYLQKLLGPTNLCGFDRA